MPERVYFSFRDKEECQPEGMWRVVAGAQREGFITAAADLMRDCDKFLSAMARVVDEWPNSCLAAMTTPSMNHRAWFGHAGCFLATGSPEDCTRLGWHTLTDSEQRAANFTADLAIELWHGQRRAQEERDMLWQGALGA